MWWKLLGGGGGGAGSDPHVFSLISLKFDGNYRREIFQKIEEVIPSKLLNRNFLKNTGITVFLCRLRAFPCLNIFQTAFGTV
jgi:hypothetical protein